MDPVHDIIVNLLHNLGSRREIQQYLSSFSGVESARFAVVKVGGGILDTSLDELASALAFLWRVGLCPVVVHGAGPQLTRVLDERGIECDWIDGQRVTTPEILGVARRVFQEEGTRLADALSRVGVRARPITSGVFEAEQTSVPGLGFVGRVRRVDTSVIRSAIETGHLPVVSPLGETGTGQILNINADVATSELTCALQPRKVVFLTPTGGLLDERGRVIPAVNLAEDYERLSAEPWVQGGMALKLTQIHDLLSGLDETASVSITSPEHLAQELFTHRGNGTLVRRGERVRVLDGIEGVDLDQLTELLESSFGRTLREGYFESKRIVRTVLAGDYTAAAVVTAGGPGMYLDKFAVTAQAQGTGLGASVWRALVESTPKLFWRSRSGNAVNPWYFERADGMHRTEEWVVFWRGLRDRAEIEGAIGHALSLEDSFTSARREVHVG
ncbi:MAG: acetylglutamate kinase [Phycisphaerales bacterium JB059]